MFADVGGDALFLREAADLFDEAVGADGRVGSGQIVLVLKAEFEQPPGR
jgi:hypothetical protein